MEISDSSSGAVLMNLPFDFLFAEGSVSSQFTFLSADLGLGIFRSQHNLCH